MNEKEIYTTEEDFLRVILEELHHQGQFPEMDYQRFFDTNTCVALRRAWERMAT